MADAPRPETVARVVRWGVVIFIIYAIVFHKSPPVVLPPQAVVVANKECNSTAAPAHDFSVYAQLLPQIKPISTVKNITEGSGAPAVCGQHADLRVQYLAADGKTVLHETKEIKDLMIGFDSLPKEVTQGLIGMKPGGARNTPLSPATLRSKQDDADFTPPAQSASANILLLALSDLPSSPMPLRIITHATGSGPAAQCGDTVDIAVNIWKMDGSKVFSSEDKPALFTIGSNDAAFGIEQAVLGMQPGATRTVILPPALQNSLGIHGYVVQPPLLTIQFPKNETVLVEIQRLPDLQKAPAAVPTQPQTQK